MSGSASVSKAVTGKCDKNGAPLDIPSIIQRVRDVDEGVALALEFALYGGLRARETLCLKPHRALSQSGEDLHVRAQGSKGGRERWIKLIELPNREPLMDALRRARVYCRRIDHTLLRGLSMQQALSRLYRVCKKAGLTKSELGVTFHAFRHEFVHQYWRKNHQVIPLDGPIPLNLRDDRSLALMAVDQRLLIEAVGHSDPAKTAAYYGSHVAQRKASGIPQPVWSRAVKRLEDIAYGDVTALRLRREQLMTLSLREVDDIVDENYMQGTQHRTTFVRPVLATPATTGARH